MRNKNNKEKFSQKCKNCNHKKSKHYTDSKSMDSGDPLDKTKPEEPKCDCGCSNFEPTKND